MYTSGDHVYVKADGMAEPQKLIDNYKTDMWYKISMTYKADVGTLSADLNGWRAVQPVAVDAALATGVFKKFTAKTGDATQDAFLIDNIRIAPFVQRETVPAPQPVDTGDYHLIVQTCNLWREGTHIGWSILNDGIHDDHKPVLGWYDEGDPVVADWETKFMLEHGISSKMYCWYRNPGNSGLIKESGMSSELWEGYMKSEYRDQLNFVISFTNHGARDIYGYDDFVNNLVPYWIETFFKNPNYLKTEDNMPVFSVYEPYKFMTEIGDADGDGYAGTEADAKKALDAFRQACVDAGFGGLKIMAEHRGRSGSALRRISECGYDYVYAYTWGASEEDMSNINVVVNIQENMTAQENILQRYGGTTSVIPTASKMLDSTPWEDYGYAAKAPKYTLDVNHYKQELEWIKEEFGSPVADSEGTKFVMLDNWNEYHEGHYLSPTYGAQAYDGGTKGFGHLDVIRDVFGLSDYEHTDILPLEEGYGPYDKWFAPGWDGEHDPGKDYQELTETTVVHKDPLVGLNSVAGDTAYVDASSDDSTEADDSADLKISQPEAARVRVEASVIAELQAAGRGLEIDALCGTATLTADTVAALDGEKALEIIFSQYVDCTDVKVAMSEAGIRLYDNIAYRLAFLQGNTEIAPAEPVSVVLKTAESGLSVCFVDAAMQASAVRSAAVNGGLQLEVSASGSLGVYTK